MAMTAGRLMDKVRRAHTKINGSHRAVNLVKFYMTRDSDFDQPQLATEETPISPRPIVYDQPSEELVPSFGTQIAEDEKIFVFCTDTIVKRKPLDTMSDRALSFLRAISGTENGCLMYGPDKYAIMEIKPVTTVLGIIPQFALLCKAHVTDTPE